MLLAGDAKPRHRLKAVLQTTTIHQWHWPGVNRAVCRRDGDSARHELVERHATTCHIKVKRLSMEIRDMPYAQRHIYVPLVFMIDIVTYPGRCNFLLFFVDALVYTAETTGVKSMHRRLCDARSP